MKLKKEYLVLGALIVALSVYLAVRGRDRTHYQLPRLPEIATDQIAGIDIQGPDGHVEIKKEGDRWLLLPGAYPADGDTVRRMLEDIGGLKLTALVAESKSYSRYDLDEKRRISVQARSADDRPLRKFEVGKVAPSFSHTFVKISGDDRVFHAPGNLRDVFGRKPADFRDKTVLAFNRSAIREIRIVKAEQETVFSRRPKSGETKSDDAAAGQKAVPEDQWQVAGAGVPDGARVQRFLATLDKLKCDGYLKGRKKSDFKRPVFEVRLKDDQGEYRLALFSAEQTESDNIPGVSSQNDYVFYLEKWQADRIMQAPGDLMKKEETEAKKAS